MRFSRIRHHRVHNNSSYKPQVGKKDKAFLVCICLGAMRWDPHLWLNVLAGGEWSDMKAKEGRLEGC